MDLFEQMNSLKIYYNIIIKNTLINKFNYNSLKKIPRIKNITLNFNCKKFELKQLATSLLALELITKKRGEITTATKPNLILKIKKGNPVGCKIILKKKSMYDFFSIFIFKILPSLKNSTKKKIKKSNNITYTIINTLLFKKLEKNYIIFNTLQNININIATNTKTKQELFFLLKLFKINNLTL